MKEKSGICPDFSFKQENSAMLLGNVHLLGQRLLKRNIKLVVFFTIDIDNSYRDK